MATKKKDSVEEKQIVEHKAAPLATANIDDDLMGGEETDSRDMLLPKILLMQGLSQAVMDEKARPGEFRDSLEYKLLGSKDAPLEFIPFYTNKTWVIYEEDEKKKLVYKEQIPVTSENIDWKWDAVVDGKVQRRDQSLNFYVILPSEIAAGEGLLPYMISCRRTSYTAGKKLITFKEKMKLFNKPFCNKTFQLLSARTENEQGVFYKLDVNPFRDTTNEEKQVIRVWMEVIKTQSVKVDESDLRAEAEAAGATIVDATPGTSGGGIVY